MCVRSGPDCAPSAPVRPSPLADVRVELEEVARADVDRAPVVVGNSASIEAIRERGTGFRASGMRWFSRPYPHASHARTPTLRRRPCRRRRKVSPRRGRTHPCPGGTRTRWTTNRNFMESSHPPPCPPRPGVFAGLGIGAAAAPCDRGQRPGLRGVGPPLPGPDAGLAWQPQGYCPCIVNIIS